MKLLLQADGASRGNPGPASFGAVLYKNGIELSVSARSLGVATNNYAEYQGLIAALELARAHDEDASYLVQMDSKLAIEQMKGNWKVKSLDLMPLVSKAQQLASVLDVEFEWIPREQNKRADELANNALDSIANQVAEHMVVAMPSQPSSIRAPRTSELPTDIYFVRHGHSAHTEKNLIAGGDGDDPKLSELGIAEANAAASAIAAPLAQWQSFDSETVVISSDMVRTQMTAQTIASELGVKLRTDARIREIGFGDWGGLESSELFDKHPEDVRNWQGSYQAAPPGGESLADLIERTSGFLGQLRSDFPGQKVVVVSHMMPLRAMIHQVLQTDNSFLWSMNFAPASISVIRSWGPNQYELLTLNSCAHLKRS